MYMTIKEINEKYDGQWVYMVNLETDDNGTVFGGNVAAHSESQEKVVQAMLNDSDPDWGIYIRYAGQIPEEVSILL